MLSELRRSGNLEVMPEAGSFQFSHSAERQAGPSIAENEIRGAGGDDARHSQAYGAEEITEIGLGSAPPSLGHHHKNIGEPIRVRLGAARQHGIDDKYLAGSVHDCQTVAQNCFGVTVDLVHHHALDHVSVAACRD